MPSREAGPRGWRAPLVQIENAAASVGLGAMVVLPLAEVVARRALGQGVPGSQSVTQHLTLLIGMLGGAIAARENRLLAVSALPSILKGRWKNAAAMASGSFAMAVTIFLVVAGVQFVRAEKESGNTIAWGIPVWVVECLMPLGFALTAWRLVRNSSARWIGRLVALAGAAALVALALWLPIEPERCTWPALGLLIAATALGAPVYVTLGGAAMILFWGDGLPIASLPLDHYRLVTHPTLPSIPLFTAAGYFLAEGGASKRLVRVFQALFGWVRGGPAMVTCLVCAFFTTFTGASGVTILALGGLLLPVLLSARYKERDALGLVTSAGALGMLFPPCLPLILYAIVSQRVTVQEMFLGGLLPGTVLLLANVILGVVQAPRGEAERHPFHPGEAARAIWDAKWELLLPVVALGGLFGGFATTVETAALTALYALAIETFVYRDLGLRKDLPRILTECALVVGGVLLILGVALGFTNYLVDAQVADRTLEWAKGAIQSPLLFLVALNLLLLVVGCLMDVYSALIVVVPLVAPLGEAYGIDPVHLGIIFLANLELGYLTPPVGMNLFLASYRFGKPMSQVYRSVVPMISVRLVAVLVITYVPALTTLLPRWVEK
ncbi:MAG: TRAP transporter large permease subunit [Planctomycetes bacterium]|nr:TRAP transporter large permease subunit [Planctomycetota bacterium]